MVTINMTLTTPNCPSAAELPGQVENAVVGVSGARSQGQYRLGSAVGRQPHVG
jgi:metal-sulfur cluster biosynthetic enzyme